MKYNDNYALKLVAICVVVFILQLSIPSITNEFALISSDVLSRPWILITSIFLHGSLDHIFFNMFALAIFGMILERIIGSRKFMLIFFITGIIASIGSVFFYDAALGASGAIMGIAGCLAMIRPKMMVYIYGIAPMPMVLAVGLWALIDLVGFFSPVSTGIANIAHLTGLFSGIAFGLTWRKNFPVQKPGKLVSEREIDRWEEEYMR